LASQPFSFTPRLACQAETPRRAAPRLLASPSAAKVLHASFAVFRQHYAWQGVRYRGGVKQHILRREFASSDEPHTRMPRAPKICRASPNRTTMFGSGTIHGVYQT
jgi:hypothetical protein